MRGKPLFLLVLLALGGAGCQNTGSSEWSFRDPARVRLLHEAEFAATGEAAHPNAVALLHLEAGVSHDGDTGAVGTDEVPLWVPKARTYRLCFDSEGGADHSMEVLDATGTVLGGTSVSTGCSQVDLAPGTYSVRLRHGDAGAAGAATDRVFLAHVRPYPEMNYRRAASKGKSEAAPLLTQLAASNDPRFKACSAEASHQVFAYRQRADGPGPGEVFVYVDDQGSNQTCRFTVSGNRLLRFGPDVVVLGPSTTIEYNYTGPFYPNDFPTPSPLLPGDPPQTGNCGLVPSGTECWGQDGSWIDWIRFWSPGWLRYTLPGVQLDADMWAFARTPKYWDAALLQEKEGWFGLHVGRGTETNQPIYLVRGGSVDPVDDLAYASGCNPGSSTDYLWLTLAPNTGARVTYTVNGSKYVRDLINDTGSVQDFKERIEGHWESVKGWRLKYDVDDNVASVLFFAAAHHCRGCNLHGIGVSGFALSNLDLSYADLSDSHFSAVRFDGTNFDRAKLDGLTVGEIQIGANVSGSSFCGAKLTNVDLSGTSFSSHSLPSRTWNGSFCSTDLSGSTISGTSSAWQSTLSQAGALSALQLDGAALSDFSAGFLKGLNYDGARMADAKFVNVLGGTLDLSGTSWKGAHVERMDFSTALLGNAVFDGAWMEGAELQKAAGGTLDLSGTSWKGAHVDGIDFSGANLGGAAFDDASARGANFSGADLTGASFKGATFEADAETGRPRASFSGAVLARTNFSSAHLNGIDFSKADLGGALVDGHWTPGVVFDGASARGANFTDANLTLASFKAAHLDASTGTGWTLAASFSGAILDRADFSDALLSGVDFSQATFDSTTLDRATLDRAVLDGAWLLDADLTTAASLRGAHFHKTYLIGARLSGADLSPNLAPPQPASLQGAFLQGAELKNTDLRGANLKEAVLSFVDPGSTTLDLRYWDPEDGVVKKDTVTKSFGRTNHSALTDAGTICPDGSFGDCDTDKKWTYVPPPDGGGIDPD